MKNQTFILIFVLVLCCLNPLNSLTVDSRMTHNDIGELTTQVELPASERFEENRFAHVQEFYSVTQAFPERYAEFQNTRRSDQKVTLISDVASFPGYLPSVDSQSEIRNFNSEPVISINYSKSYRFLDQDLWSTEDFKQAITISGTFGRFSEAVTQRNRLPSRLCMVSTTYIIGSGYSRGDWLRRGKRLLLVAQAPEVINGNPDSIGEDTLKMSWLITGTLTSRESETAQFSFNGAITYQPHFYASDFQVQSTSEAVTIDHSINSGKDITITIKETISVPILLSKVFAVLATIILVFRFKNLKRWIAHFFNN